MADSKMEQIKKAAVDKLAQTEKQLQDIKKKAEAAIKRADAALKKG